MLLHFPAEKRKKNQLIIGQITSSDFTFLCWPLSAGILAAHSKRAQPLELCLLCALLGHGLWEWPQCSGKVCLRKSKLFLMFRHFCSVDLIEWMIRTHNVVCCVHIGEVKGTAHWILSYSQSQESFEKELCQGG